MTDPDTDSERLRRWRMVLGKEAESGHGMAADLMGLEIDLDSDDANMDAVLEALYDSNRSGGLGSSCPKVNRWLGDIRKYFPSSVVRLLQKDALERLNLTEMLLEPETLEHIDADVHLVGTLLSLKNVIPNKTKETARTVVRRVVEDLEKKLRNPLLEAIRGAINKATRKHRPKLHEIDWHRTIRKNLKHYLPDKKTVIAETLVGHGAKRSSMRDVVLCVDQSGSMATSVVYSSVFAAVLASVRSINTKMVVFDIEVVDLTDHLADPVDVLFGTQLGGGTDINRAVGYCEQLIDRPGQTIMVLISDLFEGGNAEHLLQRVQRLVTSGVKVVCLLALNDEGAPVFSETLASHFAALDVPAFACTPNQFPDLMAAAIQHKDLTSWAATQNIPVKGLASETAF